jgi:hypothetical protein
MEQEIKVWAVNDCDWMAAPTAEDAVKEHKNLSMDCEDYAKPLELTEEEMQRLTFQDDEEDGKGEPIRRSFRAQLNKMIAEGEVFPCFFASSAF